MAKDTPKRGRGRPSVLPGMVAEVKRGRGKWVEIGGFTPFTAAQRAKALEQQEGIKVEVIVRAKQVRTRKPKATAVT